VTIVDEKPVRANEADLGPAMRPELEHALRREIQQALEPVMADFRKESVRGVREQVGEVQRRARNERRREVAPASDAQREERASTMSRGDREPEPMDGAEVDAAEARPPSSHRPDASDVARPIAHMVDDFGEQWITSSLERGRDTICSERVRDGLRESIERTFHPLL